MKSHKDLEIWKDGIELVEEVYRITELFPTKESFGLQSQMRRSAVSIPSNIAEGSARNSDKEFTHFLHISLGSLAELETQVIISEKLGYFNDTEEVLGKIKRIAIMTRGLIKKIKETKRQRD